MNIRGRLFFKYIFLLAGLVILAHAVIPHHHFEENLPPDNQMTSSHLDHHTHNDEFRCLFTNKLFVEKSPQFKIKKQQQVNLFPFTTETDKQNTFIFCASEFIQTDFGCSNSSAYILTESPLRAPPICA